MIILSVENESGRPTRVSPDPGEAFVIFDSRKDPKVLRTGQRLSPGEVRLWKRRKVVRISVGEHSTVVDLEVPGRLTGASFGISLTMWWSVNNSDSDLILAASDGSKDIDEMLRLRAKSEVVRHHRKFDMDESGATQLHDALCSDFVLRAFEFITIHKVVADVDLDPLVADHLASRASIEHAAELERLRLSEDTETQKTRTAHDVAAETGRIEVDRIRHQFELELEKERAEHDVEVLRTKLDLFKQLSDSPGGLISLQLANDPSHVDVIIQATREHELIKARLTLDAVRALMDGEAVEGFQLQDVARRTLNSFLELAEGSIGLKQPPDSDSLPSGGGESPGLVAVTDVAEVIEPDGDDGVAVDG